MDRRLQRGISILALILVTLLLLLGCTENQRARSWGGTSTIKLKPGKQLINATWKDADLWILTKERPLDGNPETYYFSEESSLGVMEGTIIIKEQ